jgi:hypothetical protein
MVFIDIDSHRAVLATVEKHCGFSRLECNKRGHSLVCKARLKNAFEIEVTLNLAPTRRYLDPYTLRQPIGSTG